MECGQQAIFNIARLQMQSPWFLTSEHLHYLLNLPSLSTPVLPYHYHNPISLIPHLTSTQKRHSTTKPPRHPLYQQSHAPYHKSTCHYDRDQSTHQLTITGSLASKLWPCHTTARLWKTSLVSISTLKKGVHETLMMTLHLALWPTVTSVTQLNKSINSWPYRQHSYI